MESSFEFKPGDKVHCAVNMAVHRGTVLECLTVQNAKGTEHYYCVKTPEGIVNRLPVLKAAKTKKQAAAIAVAVLNSVKL
jgi:hypothetical protein